MKLIEKTKRLRSEDELLDLFVDSSCYWGNMSNTEFAEFKQQLQDLITNFVFKEKGDAE